MHVMLQQIRQEFALDSLARIDDPQTDYLFEWSVAGRRYRYAVPKITKDVEVWISGHIRWGWVKRRDDKAMTADLVSAIRRTATNGE